MGMMTSFFVAPAAPFPSEKLSEGVPAAFTSVMCDYLDEPKVAMLEHVLTGKDPGECLKALTGKPVYAHAESGIEVFQLSDDLVKALTALLASSPVEQAKRWLASGQWGRFGRRGGDLRDLVDMLSSIARLASSAGTAPNHGLFLWVCP